MAALDDRPRPGKEPTITAEAKTWVVNLACRKAKELGYPRSARIRVACSAIVDAFRRQRKILRNGDRRGGK
jgi:hypothetical protein